jgi:hypothetical protein
MRYVLSSLNRIISSTLRFEHSSRVDIFRFYFSTYLSTCLPAFFRISFHSGGKFFIQNEEIMFIIQRLLLIVDSCKLSYSVASETLIESVGYFH